jgi:hypothetical protein
MRTKVIFLGLIVTLGGFGLTQSLAARQDDEVRGAFLTTRPKASDKSNKPSSETKPSRRRPKPATQSSPPPNDTATTNKGKATTTKPKPIGQRMGLGLTLFMRDSNGLAVRVDPSRAFRKGERVRVLLETNADGYLYVFNTTDGGQPVMIYPDPELDEAGNFIQSHVPFEIPSSVAPDERLRWFAFDEHAGAEKLYFVFTREPLPAVPTEDDLITYCRENKSKCPWQPQAEVWARIQSEINAPVQVAKAEGVGRAQTATEHQAATRGIGLNRDDPEPSLVMLTAATNKNILVATLDLIHKAAALSYVIEHDAQ